MSDDRPLYVTDLVDGRAPLPLLAQRVASCLTGTWYTRPGGSGGAVIEDGDKLKFALVEYNHDFDRPHNPLEFHLRTYTLTGRPGTVIATMSIYTLPSQIAAFMETKAIPQTRKRLEVARKQRQTNNRRSENARDFIRTVAQRLNWNSSSYRCHSGEPYASLDPRYRHRRPRGSKPVLAGQIGYRDNGKHLNVHFSGLDEALVEQIVDLIVADQEAKTAAETDSVGIEEKEHHGDH